MQRIALFSQLPMAQEHPGPRDDARVWRARWVAAGIGSFEEWNAIRVVAVGDRLWLVPANPAAGDWLAAHLDAIAGVVADTAGTPTPLEWRERAIGVRSSDDMLWAYRLPSLVVQKTPGDWAAHFERPLSAPLRQALTQRIEARVRDELAAWGRLPPPIIDTPFLVLTDPGVAYTTSAISAERSGHGKPVHVLARRHVRVLSYWRIEGELFLGPLASLGFGRLLRDTPPDELDAATQRALLALPSSTSEIR